MKKLRVLWIGDGVVATGFARVNHSIIKYLDYRNDFGKYEVHHLAVNYFGDPHPYKHSIYPAATFLQRNQLGYGRIKQLYEWLNPDLVFIHNDVWTFQFYLKFLPKDTKIVVYFPVDSAPLQLEWFKPLVERHNKGNLAIATYTKFGRWAVKEACPGLDVTTIPLGSESEKFYPIDIKEARAFLQGIEEDAWVVLNVHRNQPRKKIDLTIKGFAKFAENKPKNVKLYLHMALKDAGWNILDLIQRYDLGARLIITDPNLSPRNPVTSKQLNYIYNACNIGINTSIGEGFGLPNWEHSACSKAQIVPNYAAQAELYANGRGILIPIDRWITNIDGINTEGGLVHEDEVAKALSKAYEQPNEAEVMAQKMLKFVNQKKFRWSNIAKKFDGVFKSIL